MVDETLATRTIQGYGWKPSLPDARDVVADTSELPVLDEVDPRHDYMTPVYDQLQLGSCTSNTVAEAIDADLIVSGHEPMYPSRLWIYALERLIEGSSLFQDTGAYGRDGFKVSKQIGIVPENVFPYSDDPEEWSKDPRDDPHWGERKPMEHHYKHVPRRLDDFKRVLSNRQTIGFGFSVYESFESAEVAKTGIMPVPNTAREKMVGGHEVLLVGYLPSEPHYGLVRNHWNTDWGIDGYFLMPWQILLDPSMSSDFRTIYRPKGK